MHRRIDVATDLAMLGAWDASRDGSASAPDSATLDRDAAEGHLFLVRTGADVGGAVDVFIDTAVPPEIQSSARAIDGQFLLSLPTGRLVVGGAEDYRATKRQTIGEDSIVTIAPGDYAVRCYVPVDDEQTPAIEQTIEQLVGPDNLRWFDRVNLLRVAIGFATLLLFPVLLWFFSWMIALLVTVAVFIAYWWVTEWLCELSSRYRELERTVTPARLANQPALLTLDLRRLSDHGNLKGGNLTIEL